jgi:hypothetical protein
MEFSPQFKSWFGNSKVVDKNGQPLRVYHGSNRPENFDSFRINPMNAHSPYGFYFTDDPDYASEYSGMTQIGSKTLPVYLKLEHPMDFYEFRELIRSSRKNRINPIAEAIKQGFDGVITTKADEFGMGDLINSPQMENNPRTFIVFSSNQIKSAIGNNGNYNPEDERITESPDYRQESLDSVPLFTFMTESKAFRNEKMVEKYDTKELSDLLFTMLLALHVIGPTQQCKKYCNDSLKFPKYDHIFLSSTDLANAVTSLRNAKELLNQTNIDVPIIDMKHYLRNIAFDKMSPEFDRAFFFKLQNKLRIKDGNLLTLRREIVGETLNKVSRLNLGTKLYKRLSLYEKKCDVLVLLQNVVDESLTESKKQNSSDSGIQQYMEELQRKIIQSEGSLEGMCYDACLEMKKKFPNLHWYEGAIKTKKGWESHSWMVANDGTIYDPTITQFLDKPTYEKNGETCIIRKIDGKRIDRLEEQSLMMELHNSTQKYQIPKIYNGAKIVVTDNAPKVAGDMWIGFWSVDMYAQITIYVEKKFVDACIKNLMTDEIEKVITHEYYECRKTIELARQKYPKLNPYTMAEKDLNLGGIAHELTVKEHDKMKPMQYVRYLDKLYFTLGLSLNESIENEIF